MAKRRSALVDSDDDDDDDDENLFEDNDKDDDTDDEAMEKQNDHSVTNDSQAESAWSQYNETLDSLKEFLVEQPTNGSSDSASAGLQPFDLSANVALLKAQGGSFKNVVEIDKALSKVADSRKWSFHKDALLEFLTKKGDTLSLEGKLLVGIVARQILLRSKAEQPPNKSLGQELFVKLKGDADKSNSVALYVTSKWPKEFFQEIRTKPPPQLDSDLRIHILKIGFEFVANAFVIDTAKKVDLLKSRNLSWADFSQKVYQWALQNTHKETSRLMEAAEHTKNHLKGLGATFAPLEEETPMMKLEDDNTIEDKNSEHVISEEDDLKRIEAEKAEERRAALRSKMRRGSKIANSTPSHGQSKPTMSVPASASVMPRATPIESNSYPQNTIAQVVSTEMPVPVAQPIMPAATMNEIPPSGVSYHEPTNYHQNSTAQVASVNSYASETAHAPSPSPVSERPPNPGGPARWNNDHNNNSRRQDQNQDPQSHTARPGWQERVALRPPLDGSGDDSSRQFGAGDTYTPQHYDTQPGYGHSQYHYDTSNTSVSYSNNTAIPSTVPQYVPPSGGYEGGYGQSQVGRPPIPPSPYRNDNTDNQSWNYPPRDHDAENNHKRHGNNMGGYQGSKRLRPESPTPLVGGRGRGRGLDMTRPAWMTEVNQPQNNSGPFGRGSGGPGDYRHSLDSSNSYRDSGEYHSTNGDAGRGRGMHATVPAWMVRDQNAGPSGIDLRPHQSSGGGGGGVGRGRHLTQPAWMSQQQGPQGGGPTGRPEEEVSGRGRGRGLTLPAWMTQRQQS